MSGVDLGSKASGSGTGLPLPSRAQGAGAEKVVSADSYSNTDCMIVYYKKSVSLPQHGSVGLIEIIAPEGEKIMLSNIYNPNTGSVYELIIDDVVVASVDGNANPPEVINSLLTEKMLYERAFKKLSVRFVNTYTTSAQAASISYFNVRG